MTRSPTDYSDETINAYIDGELNHDDTVQLVQAAQLDAALALRIQQLRQTKEMMRLAYPENQPATHTTTQTSSPATAKRLLASLVLLAGIGLGWLGHTVLNNTQHASPLVNANNMENPKQPWKVVMHINSTDDYMQNTLLLETENLLQSYQNNPQAVQVEIVAYGPGVTLFDANQSKFIDRLAGLKNRFANLNYAVCGRSVKKIETDKHVRMKLIPDITITSSGLHQIIKRQQEGWHYIRL